jgi:hypothetical protein
MDTNYRIDSNPHPDDVRSLDEAIYNFNVQATGISDGQLFASFLRDADNTAKSR